jgi:Xaa-Pro aminopeptidase
MAAFLAFHGGSKEGSGLGFRSNDMFRVLASVLTTSLLLFQITGVRAADDNTYFHARRDALMKKIAGSVAVLKGAPAPPAYIPFRQDNNFYYLTGIEIPGAYLLMDAVSRRTIIFLPPADKKQEEWEGPRRLPGPEAGIDEVMEVSSLGGELDKRSGEMKDLYIVLAPQETAAVSRDSALKFESVRKADSWDGRISGAEALEQALRRELGDALTIKDLAPVLDEMRRIKDAQELERMRESARIGVEGMKAAIRATEPGRFEYQIAAAAELIFQWNGAAGYAFKALVGSGPNSCLPHYGANTRRMNSGDIVVMDFGADYLYYESDITRTFPVSGRFSQEQARVYEVVLEAYKAALAKARPGETFSGLNAAAREVIVKAGFEKYWKHGVSHYLGMSTHDVGESVPFEPGMVVTIEPGVYVVEKNLGVRIEDTVLITRDGCEVLSGDAPKEIRELERLMSQKDSIFPR